MDITLMEAMEYIDQLLTEKAPRGAHKKYVQLFNDKIDKLEANNEKLEKIGQYNKHAAEKIKDNQKKINNLKRDFRKNGKLLGTIYNGDKHDFSNYGAYATDPIKDYDKIRKATSIKGEETNQDYHDSTNTKLKEFVGAGRKNMKRERPAGIYAKESVDPSKLYFNK